MSWLLYALMTIALWAVWAFLGKISLRTIEPVQATLLFGLASLLVAGAGLAAGQKVSSWTSSGATVGVVSAVCGAAGLLTFSLALGRGKASLVTPLVRIYPAVVVILSVAFLSERLTSVRIAGVLLALIGVVLVGTGG
jgi:uncharacterized membrane protein